MHFYKQTELTVCSKKAKSKLKDNLEENEDAVLSMDDEVADKTVSPQPLVVKNEDASTSKTSFYKPPTFEELQNLKEAEMLFQSNLLKLQVHRSPCITIDMHSARRSPNY